jgi:hypothetical protein
VVGGEKALNKSRGTNRKSGNPEQTRRQVVGGEKRPTKVGALTADLEAQKISTALVMTGREDRRQQQRRVEKGVWWWRSRIWSLESQERKRRQPMFENTYV